MTRRATILGGYSSSAPPAFDSDRSGATAATGRPIFSRCIKGPTMLKRLFATTAAAICWLASAAVGLAATTSQNPLGLSDMVYSSSVSVLTMLFVVALLLESAFSVIFNWRVFLTYFSTRGVKTIIMITISLIIVYV